MMSGEDDARDKRYNRSGASYLISSPYRYNMEIRVFEDRCLTCNESERFDVIHFQAKKYGLKVNRRRVYVLPELRAEADIFAAPMPFIELNGMTLDFYAVGDYILKDEALENFINEAIKNEYPNQTTG